MLEIRGHLAPLITPFTDDGSGVSEIRLARLVRSLVAQGVDGFVVCTETGEFTCLSFSERKHVLEIVVRECQGALPVLSHISTLSTGSSLDLAQHAERHGARAVVMMAPYYGTYSPLEIEWHFKTVTQYADVHMVVVDPLKAIGPPLLEKLESFDRLSVAEPPSRSDLFKVGTAVVSPGLGLPIKWSPGGLESFNRLAAVYGGAKTVKAAMQELDVEVGTPRKPLQALDREIHADLATLIAAHL